MNDERIITHLDEAHETDVTPGAYAELTTGNADGYAPRNAVVRRELRRLGLPSKERAECGYASEHSAQHWRLRSDGIDLSMEVS